MLRTLSAVLIGAALGYVNPAEALAGWRRVSFAECQWDNTSDTGVSVYYNYGILNRGSVIVNVTCPLIDDSLLTRSAINGLNVHVNEGTTAKIWMSTCTKYYGSYGYGCGTSISTSGTAGWQAISPDYSAWTASGHLVDWAFLNVQLNPSTGGDAFSGFYVTYP